MVQELLVGDHWRKCHCAVNAWACSLTPVHMGDVCALSVGHRVHSVVQTLHRQVVF